MDGHGDHRRRLGVLDRAHRVPYKEIVVAAKGERPDLVRKAGGGLDRALLGSVAENVIRLAPCPVLTVRETDKPSSLRPRAIPRPEARAPSDAERWPIIAQSPALRRHLG